MSQHPSPTGPGARFDDAASTWNRRFAGHTYLFGTTPNVWLTGQARRLAPASRLLCVADGEGRNSVWLAQQGHQVAAFDIAEQGLAKARALARQAGVVVDFSLADVDGFDWPQATLDAVVAVFVQFADPAQRARLFIRMAQALKPGGLLLLQGYTPQQLEYKTGGPPHLSHLYTEALLREEFSALDILQLESYEAVLDEGAGHSGRSALIGLVARHKP